MPAECGRRGSLCRDALVTAMGLLRNATWTVAEIQAATSTTFAAVMALTPLQEVRAHSLSAAIHALQAALACRLAHTWKASIQLS